MWRVVLTVVLWNTISSQPVTDDLQNRSTRQLNYIECCPCPGSNRAGVLDLDKAVSTDALARAAALDDCPCRPRENDSQGSPSVFLPRAVTPVRPLVTHEVPKEDVKPLLKPEVGLASSMLETLREVTDEEYQDALARDVARNAARVAELRDSQPETAKNVLTIIVNPGEDSGDVTPEASQPFESHCVPPSDTTNLGQVRKMKKVPVSKLQPSLLGRNLLDLDSGASDVQSVVNLNKGLEGLKLKTRPTLLKLFPPRKSDGGSIQSLLKLKNNKLPKNAGGAENNLNGGLKPKLPSFKLPSLFKNNENATPIRPLGLGLNKLNIPKIRTSLARQPKNDVSGNNDSNPSPSIIQEQYSEPTTTPPFELKSLLPVYDITKSPFNLQNFLNLKDVELIPPKSPKIILPSLKPLPFFFPPLRVNNPKTDFVKTRKSERLTNNCKTVAKENDEELNEQRNQKVHTAILDSIPHASENSPVIAANDIETTTVATDNTNMVQKDENIKTEIIDTLPGASGFNEIFVANENLVETSTPRLEEETTDSDGDLGPQHFHETVTEPASKLSKDNLENMNPNQNSVELFISDNGNSRFEEIELVQENDQPVNEISFDISSGALDTEGQGLDLEINEDGDNLAPVKFTFSTDNGTPIFIEEENQEVNGFEFKPVQENQDVNAFEFEEVNEFKPVQENQEFHAFEFEEVNEFEPVQENQEASGFEFEPAQEIQVNGFDLEPREEIKKIDELEFEPVQETGISDITIHGDGLFRQNALGNDAETEISNQNIQISMPNLTEESSDLSKSTEESLPSEEQESGPVPKNNPLSIKDRILLRFNSLKNPKSKVTISKISQPETFERNIEENPKMSLNRDKSTEDSKQFPTEEKSAEMTTSETNQVNMQDLQNMSNSLLRESERKKMTEVGRRGKIEGNTRSADVRDHNAIQLESDTSLVEGNNNEENDEANYDKDSSATSLKKTFHANSVRDDDSNERADFINSEFNTEAKFDNTCPSNLFVSGGEIEDTSETEMASAASETKFNTIPQSGNPSSPLLHQSIFVQPSSLFPPIAPLDLSSVTLPTLEDIGLRISSLLGGSAKAADEEDISTNFDSVDDCPDSNPIMSSDASTTNTKSTLPVFRPLEDVNLDIFQINPLSQNSPLQSKLPSLNLNSFRTKLALPKSLGLKPLNLQSSLEGKNGGLLGATLTLGNPLSNLPSLEDLRATMRANTKSLLKSPLVSPLEDTLRTTEAFSNSLRSHTANTMKNIQQSLSSTLNEARVSNNAGEKFAKPQDLLEIVSSAHDDVKDKLYGIHVDLQDRLTSLHDNILDKSKFQIPTLQTPFLSGLGRLQDNPSSSLRARSDLKKMPQPKLIISKKKPSTRINKPITKPKEQNKVRPFKISKAASFLTPKTVEVPKLMATSSKPLFLRPLQRDERVKLKETTPIFFNNQRQEPSKNTLKPLSATLRNRPLLRPQFGTKSVPTCTEQPTQFRNQRVGQFKSFSDSRGFPSEPQPMKVAAPIKMFNAEEGRESLRASPSPSSGSLPEFALDNPLKSKAGKPILKPISPIKLTPSKSSLNLLTLPKPAENPLVSKMREAIRIRFSRPINPVLSKPRGAEDMTNSASENKDVAFKTEPMKENVSYKCKMVCVKERQ